MTLQLCSEAWRSTQQLYRHGSCHTTRRATAIEGAGVKPAIDL